MTANKEFESIMRGLHKTCGDSLEAALTGDHTERLSAAYSFLFDLKHWAELLKGRPESFLHETASSEYALALLAVCHGQYRNAFKGLRLVLELMLQATFISTNLVELKEWLAGSRHTNWAAIVDAGNGLFSKRFCGIFFEELKGEGQSYRTIVETLYTELSECIHGNRDKRIPLPTNLKYDAATCALWLEKCKTVQMVIQFALTVRYLKEFSPGEMSRLEETLIDQLGYLGPVRAFFGGVT